MKKQLVTLMLAVALIVPTGLFTGCTTTASGKKGLDPVKVAQIAPMLETTVTATVVYAYTKNPTSIKYVDAVRTALNEFMLSTNLQPSVLKAKIYALPIKELKSAEAQLIIAPLLDAYKAFGEQYVRAGMVDQTGWKMLVKAMVDGIDAGLDGVRQIQTP